MLNFHIATIFPNYFDGPFSETIIKRAQEKKLVRIDIHNLRDYSLDKHHKVDDVPFGGGPGMVMSVQPFYDFLNNVSTLIRPNARSVRLLTSPKGRPFDQTFATELSSYDHIVLLCGRYEGVDQRVSDYLVDEEVSIGNYILSGGELAAAVIIDAVTRLIPGVLGNPESLKTETFESNTTDHTKDGGSLVEYPQYTRPAIFKNSEGEEWKVPEVLLKGNHAEIEKWRSNSRKPLASKSNSPDKEKVQKESLD